MSVTFRVIALSLITTFLVGGPLAPLARAQQPASTAAPQTDLFQESLKASQGEMVPERPYPVAYDVGAALADIFYIPGKAFTCALGLGAGIAVLAISFGTAYRFAVEAGQEGCGGKWVLTGKDLRPLEPASRYEQDSPR